MNDGGQAFPVAFAQKWGVDFDTTVAWGMTLRDYFAAHASYEEALAMVRYVMYSENRIISIEEAKWRCADAMLAEREKEDTE